jgi:hypothetical protein
MGARETNWAGPTSLQRAAGRLTTDPTCQRVLQPESVRASGGRWIKRRSDGRGASSSTTEGRRARTLPAAVRVDGSLPALPRGSARRVIDVEDDGELSEGRGRGCRRRERLLRLATVSADSGEIGAAEAIMWRGKGSRRARGRRGVEWCAGEGSVRAPFIGSRGAAEVTGGWVVVTELQRGRTMGEGRGRCSVAWRSSCASWRSRGWMGACGDVSARAVLWRRGVDEDDGYSAWAGKWSCLGGSCCRGE